MDLLKNTSRIKPTNHRCNAFNAATLYAFFVIFLGFNQAWKGIFKIWYYSAEYGSSFIVVPIALYLLNRQHTIRYLYPQALWGLLIPIFPLWLFSIQYDIAVLQQLTAVLALQCIILCFWGPQFLKTHRWALIYLFLLVPNGDFLVPVLMQWTTLVTQSWADWLGVELLRNGFFLVDSANGQVWQIIEACSGFRYLWTTLLVIAPLSFLFFGKNYIRQLIYIFSALIFMLVLNWIRATSIVLLSHYSKGKLALSIDHLLYGWSFFFIAFFILVSVGLYFATPSQNQSCRATEMTILSLPPLRSLIFSSLMISFSAVGFYIIGA